MSEPTKHKEKVGQSIADKTQEAAAKIHAMYEPQWNARADVLKTLVSLSSASIVLSVTFSSSLRALNVDRFWRYLIVFSFALFVASLIVAIIALRAGTKLYESQSNIFDRQKDIKKAYIDSPSDEQFLYAISDIVARSFTPIQNSDKLAHKLFHISSACFCSAVVALAIVGAVQLLS
jgi:hypothetical protein